MTAAFPTAPLEIVIQPGALRSLVELNRPPDVFLRPDWATTLAMLAKYEETKSSPLMLSRRQDRMEEA
eukprot:3605918-Pyramimonas_sp.AAC.1